MSDDESQSVKPLIRRRGTAKSSVTRVKTFLEAFNIKEGDHEKLELFYSRLSLYEQEWKECHEEIMLKCPEEEITDQNQRLLEFDDLIIDVTSKAMRFMKQIKNSQQSNDTDSNSVNSAQIVYHQQPLRMAPIKIIPFNGKILQWNQFKEMFLAVSGQQQPPWSDIERFHRLKETVQGDALKLIDGLSYTGSSFKIAWELLESRYENVYTIASLHTQELLASEPINEESGELLLQLIDTVTGSLAALESLKIDTSSWDMMTITIVSSKLDVITRQLWEAQIKAKELPTWSAMSEFLLTRARVLMSSNILRPKSPQHLQRDFQPKKRDHFQSKPRSSKTMMVSNPNCIKCKQHHYLYHCSDFIKMSTTLKYDLLKSHHICFNCFDPSHQSRDCPSTRRCKICNKKHNSLLHPDNIRPADNIRPESDHDEQEQNAREHIQDRPAINAHVSNPGKLKQVILATAVVIIHDNHGIKQKCRALLDIGSMDNFITENLVQRLKLKKYPTFRPIEGVNSTSSQVTTTVTTNIESTTEPMQERLQFLVVPKVTGDLPNAQINTSNWKIPQGLQLADPKFDHPHKIDLLIGGGLFSDLLKDGRIKISEGEPTLINTKLGWIVAGETTDKYNHHSSKSTKTLATICGFVSNQKLNEQLETLIRLDGISKSDETTEDAICESLFTSTTIRGKDGRYQVHLPLRDNIGELGDSRKTASKQLERLLLRLSKDNLLQDMYYQFMKEYEELGHMEEVKDEFASPSSYYLPHHGVLKINKSSTKLRVVFNGSQTTSTGLSINDLTYNGGLVQDDLLDILLRFRFLKYVFGSDVEKMYRQTWIHPPHQVYQRILWQRPGEDKVTCFQLKTITYGTKSAPHLATRSLKQLALDSSLTHPLAANIILNNTYVDDVLGGDDDIIMAQRQQIELQDLLSSARMRLHKWSANHSQLLQNIPMADREPLTTNENEGGLASLKALGIHWCPEMDELFFKSKEIRPEQRSKRDVLSTIATTFDPMGLLSPFLIKLKIFMQQTWKLNLAWDDKLPDELQQEWNTLSLDAHRMSEIKIPRFVKLGPGPVLLLGFSDASKDAMGACIYVRSENGHGKTMIRLLCSKSKVAPLSNATIPRLELNAALMLAQLTNRVVKALNIKHEHVYLWTDSMIVLCWLKKNVDQLQTFVHNRVRDIHSLTPGMIWNHVRTHANPADLASRGATINELKANKLWWNGPDFLLKPQEQWPQSLLSFESDQLDELVRQELKSTYSLIQVQSESTFIQKFSSFRKIQRVSAYVLRFINSAHRKIPSPKNETITRDEYDSATIFLVKLEQSRRFPDEIKNLAKGDPVSKHSNIRSLNPFIDAQGVIRVGGRLQHAQLEYNSKHPLLLPDKSHLVETLIRCIHLENSHLGQLGLLAQVRQQYWPINARTLIRTIVKACTKCFRVNPTTITQQMGQLPIQRVSEAFPFQKTGTDFGGPFFIKQGGQRSTKLVKVYICLFVCQATKAIHIELVSDLSTQAFIMAFLRFVSRRGLCTDIYSDNGTNFVGGNRELQELLDQFNSEEHNQSMTAECAKKGIQWHFSPAGSPHFNGLSEAGIKQAKLHMRKIIGTANLTFEEMTTVLAQIEAVLNSRPLTAMTQDPSDMSALTPGHFLIGRPLTAVPEPSLDHINASHISKYQRLHQLSRHFWNRWHSEYLAQLQQRNKWQSGATTIQVGQLALIREENVSPLQWRLGRITEIHPGQDGITRAVTLKTPTGLFSRAVHKISVLPSQVTHTDVINGDLVQHQVQLGENVKA